jgi:hypothetical protein
VRLRDRGSILEVDDVPGMHWLLGLLFVVVGSLFLVGPLGVFNDADKLRWWLRMLISGMGAAATGVGVWQIARAPRSRLTIDRGNARARLERTGIGGRIKYEWPLSAIAAVDLIEKADDEGGAVFQVRLFLRESLPVPISTVWAHGREAMERVARAVASSIGVNTVNVRSESDAKNVARP